MCRSIFAVGELEYSEVESLVPVSRPVYITTLERGNEKIVKDSILRHSLFVIRYSALQIFRAWKSLMLLVSGSFILFKNEHYGDIIIDKKLWLIRKDV